VTRPTYPRRAAQHEDAAGDVLHRFALRTGWNPSLPVPVEQILEEAGLTILCEEIDEPEGAMILGALEPATGIVRLNERHMALFDSVIGPERFTYAHELGHWTYDAVDGRTQASLFGAAAPAEPVLCRTRSASETADIREINANGFASALLLPEALLRAEVRTGFSSRPAFNTAAASWGVSKTTLRIRLEKLGLAGIVPQ
jgi:Zn-dependent peptidase ImmA (M78 family)